MAGALHCFVNCRFDEGAEHFHLISFTLIALRIKAVCADSVDDGSDRLTRIVHRLRECELSIHDLSVDGLSDGDTVARFNMPLELGIAIGRRYYEPTEQDTLAHRYFVLTREPHIHDRLASDLSGLDPYHHNDEPRLIVDATRNIIVKLKESERYRYPGTDEILSAYEDFKRDYSGVMHGSYTEYLRHILQFIRRSGLECTLLDDDADHFSRMM